MRPHLNSSTRAVLCALALTGCAPVQLAAPYAFAPATEAAPPASTQRPLRLMLGESGLIEGQLPSLPYLQAVDSAAADRFWNTLQAERIEYRYIVGSCEDRAQYINLMLREAGIYTGKVWVIAPARYTLMANELISVQDPYGIGGDVTWGHHVAPIFEMEHGGRVDTMVVDQSFSPDRPLTLDEWLARLDTPRSVYFFTTSDDYLFNSLDGLKVTNPTARSDTLAMPLWFPNVLTGDFMTYGYGLHGVDITGGMAKNDVALQIHEGRLPSTPGADERGVLARILRSENEMNALLGTNPYPGLSAETLTALRGYYQERIGHWDARLRRLSNVPAAVTTERQQRHNP